MPTFVAIGVGPGLLDVGRGGGAVDLVGPIISGVVVTEIKPATGVSGTTVRVVALTDEPATVVVQYGTLSGAPYANTTAAGASGTSHAVDVPGLLGGTPYYLRVVATDAALNVTNGTEETITTRVTPSSIFGADLQFHHSAYLSALGDAGAGIAAWVDDATQQFLQDWSGKGVTINQPSVNGRALFQATGANGAPGLLYDGTGDNYPHSTDVAGLNLTGARCVWVVLRGTAAALDHLIVRYDVTTNTIKWAFSTAADGGLSVLNDGGGGVKTSTYKGFLDGANHAPLWNRDASGNEDFWADGAFHQTYTGQSNTDPTGGMRIGCGPTGANIFAGHILEIGIVGREATDDELAVLYADCLL